MTLEELEEDYKKRGTQSGTVVCDPCKSKPVDHAYSAFASHLVQVETAHGLRYMWLTADGSYVPAEEGW